MTSAQRGVLATVCIASSPPATQFIVVDEPSCQRQHFSPSTTITQHRWSTKCDQAFSSRLHGRQSSISCTVNDPIVRCNARKLRCNRTQQTMQHSADVSKYDSLRYKGGGTGGETERVNSFRFCGILYNMQNYRSQ